MSRTMINGLILGLSTSLLVACGGSTDSSSSSSKMLATTAACYAAWNSTTAYSAGQTASYANVNYTAAFWTQGQNPSTNSGPSGSGQPWITNGTCGSTSTPTMTESSSISTGSNLSVSYSVPSGQVSSKNWVGVYPAGVTPGSGANASAWAYAPNASGSVTVNTSGLAAGSYAVWYLYNDGYTVLKGPQSLAISSSAPTLSEPASINAGSTLSVSYSVPSNQVSSTNWVGVYPAGVTPGSGTSASAWVYAPNASGSVTVNTSGLAGGSYAVWYLYNDGYTVLSGPQNLTINSSAPPGWTLDWSDEFNGTALDTSKWNIEVNGTGYGNNELEYYTNRPQNISVSGGNLVITAIQENYTGPDGTKPYTSGRINTSAKFSQTYGRMEARMKLPAGQGVWPAFWMLGANIGSVSWPACGEIDIMEHINTEALVHGTIHWTDVNGNHAQYSVASGNVDVTQWHVYAVEWDTNDIKWFVDGTQYMDANIANNINNTGAFHNPFFMIFNLAVGGDWPGNPDGSVAFPQQMLVDYVRVYHK